MSHELDDNIERRQAILLLIPKAGVTAQEMLRIIMSLGYNQRGAREKLRELRFLGLLEELEGKIYVKK